MLTHAIAEGLFFQEAKMNKEWKEEMLIIKSLPSWTIVPHIMVEKKKELCLSNDHILFIQEILHHDEGYVMYDEDMQHIASLKTLREYRKYLQNKGYLSFPTRYNKQTDNGFKSSGFVYKLDGLLKKLQLFYSSEKVEKVDSKVGPTFRKVEKVIEKDANDLLLRNLPKKSSIRNINNSDQSTINSAHALEGASGSVRDEHCLTALQDTILTTFKSLYPLVKVRPGDMKNLKEITFKKESEDERIIVHGLYIWENVCRNDSYLSDKDGSLTLYLNNMKKVKDYYNHLKRHEKYDVTHDIWMTVNREDHHDEEDEYVLIKTGVWNKYPLINYYEWVHVDTGIKLGHGDWLNLDDVYNEWIKSRKSMITNWEYRKSRNKKIDMFDSEEASRMRKIELEYDALTGNMCLEDFE